jgi:hypothetical protein
MSGNVAPKIVTKGLVLCLDGANVYSYPKTGTAWSDLTTNRNNSTLINGPTYDSSNGGSLLFDGINDFANITYNSTLSVANAHTLESWFYATGRGTNSIFDGSGHLMRAGQIEDSQFQLNYIYDYGAIGYLWFRSFNGNPYPSAGSFTFLGSPNYVAMPNKWNMATVARNGSTVKIYVNGVLVSTYTGQTISSNPSWITYLGGSLTLGRTTGNPYINYKGKIAVSRIYNRALSDSEVLQNFNALKGRFGL